MIAVRNEQTGARAELPRDTHVTYQDPLRPKFRPGCYALHECAPGDRVLVIDGSEAGECWPATVLDRE